MIGTRQEQKCQTACKPGSVRAFRRWTAIPLGHASRRASRDQPGRRDENVPAPRPEELTRPSLFGLAPGGVYPAAPVARGAVRSYRTVSPLPAEGFPRAGGLFSVALSLGSPPPAVSRHRIPVEPGLSSIVSPPTGGNDSGRPAVWRGGHEPAAGGRQGPGASPLRSHQRAPPPGPIPFGRRVSLRCHQPRETRTFARASIWVSCSPAKRSTR